MTQLGNKFSYNRYQSLLFVISSGHRPQLLSFSCGLALISRTLLPFLPCSYIKEMQNPAIFKDGYKSNNTNKLKEGLLICQFILSRYQINALHLLYCQDSQTMPNVFLIAWQQTLIPSLLSFHVHTLDITTML